MSVEGAHSLEPPKQVHGVQGPVLGMVLFITSEVMFFGALFAAYGSIRARSPEWPPSGVEIDLAIPIALTAILLTSSVFCHRASAAARRGDPAGARRALFVTIGLGMLFLAGQAFEYSGLDFALGDSAFATLFYSLTGFHGLHVFIGLVILSAAVVKLQGPGLQSGAAGTVEAASFYWHFVDGIWLLLFTVVYLIR